MVKSLCETPEVKAINTSQLTIEHMVNEVLTNKGLLVLVDYANLKKEMEIVRKHNLYPRILIYGVWPEDNGKDENPSAWTSEDIIETKIKIERIKEIMSI